MATGMEQTIFQSLIGIFGGNVLFLALFAFILGAAIIFLCKIPLQGALPLLAMLGLIIAGISVGFGAVMWLFLGVIIAFFIYHLMRGG